MHWLYYCKSPEKKKVKGVNKKNERLCLIVLVCIKKLPFTNNRFYVKKITKIIFLEIMM